MKGELMKTMLKSKRWQQLKSLALRIHRDERGAEGLEKLLIVAAIVLPLLGILLLFRNAIIDWVTERWDEVRDGEDEGLVDSID